MRWTVPVGGGPGGGPKHGLCFDWLAELGREFWAGPALLEKARAKVRDRARVGVGVGWGSPGETGEAGEPRGNQGSWGAGETRGRWGTGVGRLRGPRITLDIWSLAGEAMALRGWRGPDAPQECGVGCEGPRPGVRRREGGARHSSRSILVSGRGGWWTRGSWRCRGVAGPGPRSSWQPRQLRTAVCRAGESLPLAASPPRPSATRRFRGARTARGSGRPPGRAAGGRQTVAQVTSSRGLPRPRRLGGRGPAQVQSALPEGRARRGGCRRGRGQRARRSPPPARTSQARSDRTG